MVGKERSQPSLQVELDHSVTAEVKQCLLTKSSSVPNPTGATVHSRLHTNGCYEAVNELLESTANKSEAEAILGVLG